MPVREDMNSSMVINACGLPFAVSDMGTSQLHDNVYHNDNWLARPSYESPYFSAFIMSNSMNCDDTWVKSSRKRDTKDPPLGNCSMLKSCASLESHGCDFCIGPNKSDSRFRNVMRLLSAQDMLVENIHGKSLGQCEILNGGGSG